MTSLNSQSAFACKSVALTGATGFLGGHILEKLVAEGILIHALTRKPQPKKTGVEWIIGDLNNQSALTSLCKGADTVIHCAGLVKALDRNAFFDANVGGTKNILNAAALSHVKHFIHISSLTAREPHLSHYSASKAAAEVTVKANKWPFAHTIIRPPAIYGPGDMEILKMLKTTKFGFLPAPASKQNRFSMIHVSDAASLIIKLTNMSHKGEIIEPDDGKSGAYRIRDVASAILASKPDGAKRLKILTIPAPMLKLFGAINGGIAAITRKPAIFTYPKSKELAHNDWTVRASRKPRIKDWKVQYDLVSGLKNTVAWYRDKGYL